MMDKYDLSYRIQGGQVDDVSLVVERLQWDPPDFHAEWDAIDTRENTREIKVLYRLNTMPPGIPTWFIARSHRFSKKLHWRTGALLGHGDGQHLALVRADTHRNIVELAVRGPTPAAFFSVLDDGLNLTLERFPGLQITRQVPCRCGSGLPGAVRLRGPRRPPRPHAAEGHDRVPQVRRGRVRAGAAARARTVRTRHRTDERGRRCRPCSPRSPTGSRSRARTRSGCS